MQCCVVSVKTYLPNLHVFVLILGDMVGEVWLWIYNVIFSFLKYLVTSSLANFLKNNFLSIIC